MSLPAGTRLGPYGVTAPIGQGGMSEVYRARDTKLGRDVAGDVLPDTFAHDPERLARCRREAHVLASLNHPNVAQIYGLEDTDAAPVLVMELVEVKSKSLPNLERPQHVRPRQAALPHDHEHCRLRRKGSYRIPSIWTATWQPVLRSRGCQFPAGRAPSLPSARPSGSGRHRAPGRPSIGRQVVTNLDKSARPAEIAAHHPAGARDAGDFRASRI
jgi:hypothetical protein